jgi:alkylation response protein AidB-like acyl-CoA dehydrogenase
MYFGLSEEQQFFQESITKYLEDIVTVDSLREYRKDYDNDLSKRVYNGLNELGICGLIIPDEYGGLGLDSLFAISISEALGKGVAPYPYIGSFLIAPYLINSIANNTQKKRISQWDCFW